jgi:1-aminocyclopropane-1-carboxylate deaminase
VGTGGTMAGIINGLGGKKKIIGIPVLKNGDFLVEEIKPYLNQEFTNWSLLTEYHHGGYAKTTPGLLTLIEEMEIKYQLPLDHVYTGKLLWAVMEEIRKGSFPKGSTILALHTGGLQGFFRNSY